MDSLDQFYEKLDELRTLYAERDEKARMGERIVETLRTGVVSPDVSREPSNPEYYDAVRSRCWRVLCRHWNDFRLPLEVWKGCELVWKFVMDEIDYQEKNQGEKPTWDWGEPKDKDAFKNTAKRRFNELQNASFCKGHYEDGLTRAIRIQKKNSSLYIPNAVFMPPETRDAILAEVPVK